MPYRPSGSTSRRNGAVIELSIPMRIMRGEDGAEAEADDESCYICANSFCGEETCGRAATHLACCTQAICCACLLKSSKRCLCKDDCDAVISLCPFCREVAPVEALDIFLGGKPACAACAKKDSAPAPPPAPASECSDDEGSESDDDEA